MTKNITGWDLAKLNFITALKVLPKLKKIRKLDLENLVIPLYYARTKEIPPILNMMDIKPTDRVLDVSSPKIAALYTSLKIGAKTYATDIDEYFMTYYAKVKDTYKLDNLNLEIQDARNLTYKPETFDKIFSISVIEHIPEDGDITAVQQMADRLKSGGMLAISVPYFISDKEDFKDIYLDKFYYSQHSQKNEVGKVFFEKHYSESGLHNRIINPSGLELVHKIYIGSRFTNDWVGKTVDSRLLRPFLGVFHTFFANMSMINSDKLSDMKSVGGAIIILKKK